MEPVLVDNIFVLQRFAGKGGWTYAEIPGVTLDKQSAFGWVRVKGMVDDHSFEKYNLMPLRNGNLFLPVKAAVRMKIGKEAGDSVRVVLYRDDSALEVPEELLQCLKDEPAAYTKFVDLKEGEKKEFINWIYSAKKEETRVERMVRTMEKLLKGEGFRGKVKE